MDNFNSRISAGNSKNKTNKPEDLCGLHVTEQSARKSEKKWWMGVKNRIR